MDLILWRHAEAREAREGEADADRPLTPRGDKQALRMAEWLNRYLPERTRVLVSPTLRTRRTAEALGRKFRVIEGLAPGALPHQLLDLARWPEAREPALVIGHQPVLGQVAAYLMGGAVSLDLPPWTVRKGGIWWLRHRQREERPEVVLVTVRPPDMV